jgi:hypothetical protein
MIGRLGKEVDGIIGSSPMIYPLKWTHEDRTELLVSAVIGAALGIVTGYLLRSGWFNIVI